MSVVDESTRSNDLHRCFVMIDEDYTCIAVSIYHLDNEVYSKMSDKDVFFVLDPLLKNICINYNGTV